MTLSELTDLLQREEIHVSWSFFEQRRHFIKAIQIHSIRSGFSTKLLKHVFHFVLNASDSKLKQNKLNATQVENILDSLHPNKSATKNLDPVIKMLVQNLPKIEAMKVKSAVCTVITRFLIARQHPTSTDVNHQRFQDGLNLCDTVFNYCVDYIFKFNKTHLMLVLNWFAILASPEILILRGKLYEKRYRTTVDKFFSIPFDASVLYIKYFFEDLGNVLKLKNPFLHYHKVEEIGNWLKKHEVIIKRDDAEQLEPDFHDLPEVDSIIYSPILIGEKLVAEMSFILSNYPEFNTTLFNIFNGTCKSHDCSVIFKNVSDSKIVFFDALRQVISKKEYHDEIYQTLVRALDSVEENQNQQLNTSENNTGTTCIPETLHENVTNFLYSTTIFNKKSYNEIISQLYHDSSLKSEFQALALNIKWSKYELLLDEIIDRKEIITEDMMQAFYETCPEMLKLVYIDLLKQFLTPNAHSFTRNAGIIVEEMDEGEENYQKEQESNFKNKTPMADEMDESSMPFRTPGRGVTLGAEADISNTDIDNTENDENVPPGFEDSKFEDSKIDPEELGNSGFIEGY